MNDEESLNALGLEGQQTRPVLRFGSVDVSFAARTGTMREGLNQLSTAEIELDYGLTAGQPVDFLAPVELGRRDGANEHVMFIGAVTEAEADGPVARISALSTPGLTETTTGVFVGRNVVAPEIMHLMARTAGLPEDRIRIEALDGLLPLETIEVVFPIQGLEVSHPVALGEVTLVPPSLGQLAVADFEHSDAVEEFNGGDSYAIFVQVGRRMLDAELNAIAEVEATLAWFVVRSRYGLAMMPDGEPQPFRRDRARSKPARGRLVVVRGIVSGRSWLRTPGASEMVSPLRIDSEDASWLPPRSVTATLQDRQALLACARAASESDPLQQVQALWEAIEFYVSGVAPPTLFDRAQAKRVRKAIPGDVDPALRQRALDLLAKINEAPLMARLNEAVRRDGVPVAESELVLLRSLRDARNDAVHGRSPALPYPDEIAHAVSVVSRMLLYRLARRRTHGSRT